MRAEDGGPLQTVSNRLYVNGKFPTESVVQNDAQKRSVDVKPAVILDEAQFSKFVHEEIHTGARGANHFGEHFL